MRPSSLIVLSICILSAGCFQEPAVKPPPEPPSPFAFATPKHVANSEPGRQTMASCKLQFVDVHGALGIEQVYVSGAAGESLMVETTGGGAGWVDYDSDGHVDLFLNQGGDPAAKDPTSRPLDALYRNMVAEQFSNVTHFCRIREYGYGQGVAVGDFDNDGFDDIYVTNVGGNSLWHNLGDGTFVEITKQAGVQDGRWSSSAAWADLDLDGDLDLYVCNYLQYDPYHPMSCNNAQNQPRICHPKDVVDWPDECYFNQGDGRFKAEAQQRGLFGPDNKALGVAVADFNNDGLPDIYIANDTKPNFMFINQGAGYFKEMALELACAVDRNGLAQASMGLAVGDYDGNGWLDIYSTHFELESNTLYHNVGPSGFEDVTARVGLHQPTLPFLAFGTVMHDFNQDGKQELFVVNGHIENYPGNPKHRMNPQLFTFAGPRWVECTQEAGEFFRQKQVGRGVATADYDSDGDLDIVAVHQDTPAAVLRNDSERGHWLKLRFIGGRSNRRGIGVRVTVTSMTQTLTQELCGGTSYASSHEPVLIFGLGDNTAACQITVRWPSGKTTVLSDVAVDQSLTVSEGEDAP